MLPALLLLVAQGAPVAQVEPPTLDAAEFDAWRTHIVPSSDDLRYGRIDWQPTFQDGVRAAAAADRPLLLWLMNGHPLGCT